MGKEGIFGTCFVSDRKKKISCYQSVGGDTQGNRIKKEKSRDRIGLSGCRNDGDCHNRRIGWMKKNYPDIHSLVLLSSLFGISLDDLVKGDIKAMEEEIRTEDVKKLKRDGWIYFMLLCVTVVSGVPLIVGLWPAGAVVCLAIWGITMLHAHRIEKLREEGKRPYQKWVFVLIAAAIAAAVMGAGLWVMNRIGML